MVTARVHSMTGGYVFTRVCLLTGREGYLLWIGVGVPSLDGGRGTYLRWGGEEVPTLDGERGTYFG